MINNPPLLFADEPTGNLDSKTSREVLEMFKRLNEHEGITIILVTHDANVAATAKRNIRLVDGLVESGAFEGSAVGNGQAAVTAPAERGAPAAEVILP
jgi:ABC-type lipoprotein export system ATPase subunit